MKTILFKRGIWPLALFCLITHAFPADAGIFSDLFGSHYPDWCFTPDSPLSPDFNNTGYAFYIRDLNRYPACFYSREDCEKDWAGVLSHIGGDDYSSEKNRAHDLLIMSRSYCRNIGRNESICAPYGKPVIPSQEEWRRLPKEDWQ